MLFNAARFCCVFNKQLSSFFFFQLKEWTPQVSHVAKILLDYGKYSPGDVPAVSVHFENVRDIWKEKMQTLTNLVDSATDTSKFIEACGMFFESVWLFLKDKNFSKLLAN